MTQHEYIFVTVAMVLGLALTRMLNTMAKLIRHHERVVFHWASALWLVCVLLFILQLWWVGWGLREYNQWRFPEFLVLIFAAIAVYGAAEMSLPDPDEDNYDLLQHSRSLGRLSAASMLLYFLFGPYINIVMFQNPVHLSLLVPLTGALLMMLVMLVPQRFPLWSTLFLLYALGIVAVTV